MDLSAEQKKEVETVERFHTELKRIDKEVRKIIVAMALSFGGRSRINSLYRELSR